MRVLKIGFETFLVPEKISDQKVATAISILRELVPCDFEGNAALSGRDALHQVEYRYSNAKPKKKPAPDIAEVFNGES